MKISAGILVYRKKNRQIEVLLVHPGGPYWEGKDENSWSIPKGEMKEGESELEVALREFEEETGLKLTEEDKKKLKYFGEVKRPGKILKVYILEKDFAYSLRGRGDNLEVRSNLIEIEWPPHSGKIIKIPEIDQIGYFDLETAKRKLVKYQKTLIEKLLGLGYN